MPRKGYTGITVPIGLKDRLKGAASAYKYRSVPNMLESWLSERTGTVRVRKGPNNLPLTNDGGVSFHARIGQPRENTQDILRCGRRDSNPGRLRGRRDAGSPDRVRLDPRMLGEFRAFLEVERQLAPRTVYSHVRYIGKLVEGTDEAGLEEIRGFMRGHMGGSVSGYSNALKAVRVFFRDFLGRGDLVEGFRFPATPFKPRVVPGREDLRAFYDEIPTVEGRLYFLLYATSGLRRREGLSLRPGDVDEDKRMVTPSKGLGGTKSTWVTFYNREMEELLEGYTPKPGRRWIPIKTDDFRDVWRIPKEKTGISITPQVLRDWFCVAMGEAGVQDRYVDAFCGRLPKTILAKHYTDYSPSRLRRIYKRSRLKILA